MATPGDQREDHAQAVADTIAALYASAELAIIATISSLARKVAAGQIAPVAARRRLAQTVKAVYALVQPRIQAALDEAGADTAAVIREAVTADLGSDAAETVTVPDLTALATSLGDASTAAAQNASAQLSAALSAIGNVRGGAPYSSLSLSRIQAAQKALDDLAEHGITGFTDKAGRNWDLASYVEMATRTAVSNSWDDLLAQAATRSGYDLVFTYTHSTEGSCPLCLPWLGRTLSLVPSGEYPTVAEAKAAGFRHPNCRCGWYVAGAGGMQDVTNPVPDDQVAAAYKASQRQRALEHHVREAQRRSQAAITPQARSQARRGLAAARAVSAQHRSRYGVRMLKVAAHRRESLGAR